MFSHKPTKLSISMTEEHTVGKSSKEKEQGPNAPSALPNGGTKAWLSTLASFLLFLIAWGPSTSFGAFQDFYQSSILAEYSPSAISWIGTVNATLLISVGILAGPLFDRGYVRQLAAVGCFMAVLGEMMLSLSTDYYQIMLSQGFCSGIGSGLLYVPAIALINTMFTTKRSVAMGLATCGTSLGKSSHTMPKDQYLMGVFCRWHNISYCFRCSTTKNRISVDSTASWIHSASVFTCSIASPQHEEGISRVGCSEKSDTLACFQGNRIQRLLHRKFLDIHGLLYSILLRSIFRNSSTCNHK